MGRIDNIRNVAFIGHSGEGKTSLCEAVLYNCKASDRFGKVADGNTVMDYDPLEIEKKISISLACAFVNYKGVKINLIDAPGFYDFDAEATESLRAADGAVIVTSAAGVVSVGTEKYIDYCSKNNIPAMIFINAVDKENSDFFKTLDALKEKYGIKIAPIMLPVMDGTKMTGYVDVIAEKGFALTDAGVKDADIPANLKSKISDIRGALVESAAENDDKLMEKFFESGELSADEIILGVKKGVTAGRLVPVLCGSALTNKGVFKLMDDIIALLPSPAENTRIKATVLSNNTEVTVKADETQPFAAQVFKTIVDPFVGKMNLLKVFTGKLKPGMTVLNVEADKQERINQIYFIKGKKQENTDEIVAGDIGAVSKLNYTNTGNTLCDENKKIKFSEMQFNKPVYSMAIYANKQGDEDKIFSGLNKIAEEDLSFKVEKNLETSEMVLNGQGDMHIDIISKKLKNKFNVEAALKPPKIAYRETIRKIAEAEGKHKKQSGGHGQYGHVRMRFEPYAEGDFLFDEEVVGGTVPKNYIPAVEKGIRECLKEGVLAYYPMVNFKAVLYDGSYHDVDSSEMAFKLAASIAYKEGLKKSAPVLLEPVMNLKIRVPENYMGDILGDMNKRRGRIIGMELVDGMQEIRGEAPLAELNKYAIDLRSMTQGRGRFVMEFERYEEVPAMAADKIIKEREKERAEKNS